MSKCRERITAALLTLFIQFLFAGLILVGFILDPLIGVWMAYGYFF